MALFYRKLMDALYLVCVVVAGTALVLISAVIPWAVFTRYVLNSAASWPEPTAVLLTIVVTFIGAAACYRRQLHMNVSFFVQMFPPPLRMLTELLAELLVATMALFMIDLRRKAGGGDLVQHHRRFSLAVGRGDLSADPGRRRAPSPLRHRARDLRHAARSRSRTQHH